MPFPSNLRRNLLWLDCTAGALVGLIVLPLHAWLSDLFQLPVWWVVLMGTANLLYALYSFSLAVRRRWPLRLIKLLVLANLLWAVFLLGGLLVFFASASVFGVLALVLESLFVGGLGTLEWRSRELLRTVLSLNLHLIHPNDK